MTTATEMNPTTTDPFRQDAIEFQTSALELPVGAFKLRLLGNLGKGESNSGAKYINLRFQAVRQAQYDPTTGIVIDKEGEETRGKIRQAFFHKFYVGKRDGTRNEYVIRQLNSWLHAVGLDTKPFETYNQATNRYDFDRDEALSATIDLEAWTYVTHKEDPTFGWQIELEDFSTKPRYRKPQPRTNGHQ